MPIPITFHMYFGDRYLRSETLTQDVIKIGSLDSSHLRVGAKTASGAFSVIEVSGPDEVHIIDLGSVSGTIVNGQKISRTRLKSDDRLQFDNITVVVELPEPAVTYEMAASEPLMNAADLDSAEQAVEVVVMWGDSSVLHVEHLSPPRGFCVGEAVDSKGKSATDFLIGSESIGTDSLPITVESGSGVAVVIPQGATGDVTLDDQLIGFEELAEQGQLRASSALAGARQYALPAGATARVRYRGFRFIVKPLSAARRVGIGGAPRLNWRSSVWTIASTAFHVGLIMLFYFLPPNSGILTLDDLGRDEKYGRYLVEAMETVEEEPPVWDEPDKQSDSGGTGKRHKDDEGQMGKTQSEKTNNKYAIKGPEDNDEPVMSREEAEEAAANAGIIGFIRTVQGSWNSPTSPYGADNAMGDNAVSALGALMGDAIGANFGFGGLGIRDHGRGGGGTGEGTISFGNFNTIGGNAGPGGGSRYGSGGGRFHGRKHKLPPVVGGRADVRGSLSRETIRRIIHRHINEVRFCYEQALTAKPDLEGRVAIKFIISPTGSVQASAVAKSSLGNPRAEMCIAKAVERWDFPSPEGGGIVIVTYPFVLQQAGG